MYQLCCFFLAYVLIFLLNCCFNMDEKLKQIFKLRPLQTECIAYRNFTSEYKTMIKRTCVSELKNLVNVEMKIEQITVKMPDEEQIPNLTEEIKKSKAVYLLEECSLIEEGIKLL